MTICCNIAIVQQALAAEANGHWIDLDCQLSDCHAGSE